jgi:hypothetical protein
MLEFITASNLIGGSKLGPLANVGLRPKEKDNPLLEKLKKAQGETQSSEDMAANLFASAEGRLKSGLLQLGIVELADFEPASFMRSLSSMFGSKKKKETPDDRSQLGRYMNLIVTSLFQLTEARSRG